MLGTVAASPAATNEALLKVGLLFSYVNSTAVYKCPADRKQINGADTVRSMSMNAWMNPITSWNQIKGYGGVKLLRDFRKQSDLNAIGATKCWVLIDEKPTTINDGWFVVDPNVTANWYDSPAVYHNGAGGLSFADGHCEFFPRRLSTEPLHYTIVSR